MKNLKMIGLLIFYFFSSFAQAQTGIYSSDKLGELLHTGEVSVKSGLTPIVVFDVDDTLTDTNVRKAVIMREFANLPATISAYPADAKRLQSIGAADIRWTVTDSMIGFGVNNPPMAAAAEAYWLPRFFGDDYCDVDPEIAGATEYVRALHDSGVMIVYLTGRPQPTMQGCTIRGLKAHGFPIGASAQLMMKQNPKQSDLDFKNAAFAQINKQGDVIGAFENEPANVNAYGAAFPKAMSFLLDTIHSPSPVRPNADVIWLHNFLY